LYRNNLLMYLPKIKIEMVLIKIAKVFFAKKRPKMS
jgi:hypothetical protein